MQQHWTDYRLFWQEFRRTFQGTGAMLPSGQALAAALARYVREGDPCTGRRILEVGPGTGAVTRQILQAMGPNDRLELVERNEQFVDRLRTRLEDDPAMAPMADRITLHHASVEELAEDRPYDIIVSGLPLNNFPVALVEQILTKLGRLLAEGGTLSFFEYIAIRRAKAIWSRSEERDRLRAIGLRLDGLLQNEFRRDRVLANVPPAWVHHVKGGWKYGNHVEPPRGEPLSP